MSPQRSWWQTLRLMLDFIEVSIKPRTARSQTDQEKRHYNMQHMRQEYIFLQWDWNTTVLSFVLMLTGNRFNRLHMEKKEVKSTKHNCLPKQNRQKQSLPFTRVKQFGFTLNIGAHYRGFTRDKDRIYTCKVIYPIQRNGHFAPVFFKSAYTHFKFRYLQKLTLQCYSFLFDKWYGWTCKHLKAVSLNKTYQAKFICKWILDLRLDRD